jgi:hypothetical protein
MAKAILLPEASTTALHDSIPLVQELASGQNYDIIHY